MPAYAENIIPFLSRQNETLTILVVEDDRMQRVFLEEQVRDLGHDTRFAENGLEALEIMQEDEKGIDIVLMDRMMPVMDGLTAIRRMKDDRRLRNIPVVMVTGAVGQQDMYEGLNAGVFYYLGKPVAENVLRSVLTAVSRDVIQSRRLRDELQRQTSGFELLETAKFSLSTLKEAESLTTFAASFFPEPDRVFRGIAELLINAIEHGTFDVGYATKTKLLESGVWRAEIERREKDGQYAGRKVEAVLARKEDGFYLVITDQGNGFDWRKFMSIDPSRASDNHGRGIAQSRAMSFDKLTYNEKGNQVVAFVGHERLLEW